MRRPLLDTLARVFSVSPTPTALVAARRFHAVNPAFLQLGGWTLDELTEAGIDVILAPGEQLKLPPAGTDRAVDRQCRIRRSDGSEVATWLSATPLTSVGASDAILLQAVEVTRQHEQMMALERSRKAFEEFSFEVSHDLRSPMTTVQGFASLLSEALDRLEPDQVRDAAERIHRAARRMQTILEDLQDSAQAIAGREAVRSATTWQEAATWIDDALGVSVEAVGGTLDVDVPAGLVEVDLGALRQILSNLVDNAVAYRDPDRPLTVTIVATDTDGGTRVVVTDNGRGIPADRHQEIFQRGVRLHPDVEGHGTGLARCRRLVRRLGGTLSAEPIDIGARFTLWLPRMAARGAPPPTEPARRALLVAEPDRAGVLLPRLHDGTRLDVAATAADARSAAQQARVERFDLVLVDGQHPGLRRIVAELRAAAPDVVVLALAPRDRDTRRRLPIGSPGAVIYIDDAETTMDLTEVVLFAESTSRSSVRS